MTYKVIEYIDITQNTKILKIADFALYNLGKITKNGPKKRSLNHNFLKFFNRYGIIYMVCGKSSCPDNSEYVWQGGVGGLQGRVTGNGS